MYLVSSCLAGFNTRYDGTNSFDERVKKLLSEGRALPLCPEQLAGLPTPRAAIEFKGGDGRALLEGKTTAVGVDGADYSQALIQGAEETLRIAKLYGITDAVLKDGSPSCGVTYVHSEGERKPGRGVTSELLSRNGIRVSTIDTL